MPWIAVDDAPANRRALTTVAPVSRAIQARTAAGTVVRRSSFGSDASSRWFGCGALPAAVDPLLEVRAFRSDRRVEAVAGEHEHVGRQREQPVVDGPDDLLEAGALELRVAGPAREQRVAGEHDRLAVE